jgi:hypothetical protein
MGAVADSGIVERLSNQPGFTAGALDDLDAVVGGAAQGVERFHRRPVRVRGFVSAMKALRDKDVQLTLSYAVTIAKAVGERLTESK